MEFEKEVNDGAAWCADNEVGGSRRKMRRSQGMDSGEDTLLAARREARGQKVIEGGILELTESFSLVEVCVLHHYDTTHVG